MLRPVRSIVQRLRHEALFLLAAGLAFSALIAVVPFPIVVLWMVGSPAGQDAAAQPQRRPGPGAGWRPRGSPRPGSARGAAVAGQRVRRRPVPRVRAAQPLA